jgi:hypothetical protein
VSILNLNEERRVSHSLPPLMEITASQEKPERGWVLGGSNRDLWISRYLSCVAAFLLPTYRNRNPHINLTKLTLKSMISSALVDSSS